ISLPISNKSISPNGSLIKSTTLLNASDVFSFNVSQASIAPCLALSASSVTVDLMFSQMDDARPLIPFQIVLVMLFKLFQALTAPSLSDVAKLITVFFKAFHIFEAMLFIACHTLLVIFLNPFQIAFALLTSPVIIWITLSFNRFHIVLACSLMLFQICDKCDLNPSKSPVAKSMNKRIGPSITFLISSQAA